MCPGHLFHIFLLNSKNPSPLRMKREEGRGGENLKANEKRITYRQ